MVQGPAVPSTLRWSKELRDRLLDPNESDEDLSEELSRQNGYPVQVTTVTGDFEVRRLQMEWSVQGAAVLDEDVRVCTFHHLKLSGSAPVNTWDQADFDLLVTQYKNFWGAIGVTYSPGMILSALKFYREGPNIVPPQPPVFQTSENVPGAASASQVSLPPQCALSVTEIAGSKKNWGRFYLPAPALAWLSNATVTVPGRPSTVFMQLVADAFDVLCEAALTANLPLVVYRPKLEAGRPHEGETPLPERPANAQTVETIQVDDVWDTQRRRRWEKPTLRLQRAIGSSQSFQIGAGGPQPPELGEDGIMGLSGAESSSI